MNCDSFAALCFRRTISPDLASARPAADAWSTITTVASAVTTELVALASLAQAAAA